MSYKRPIPRVRATIRDSEPRVISPLATGRAAEIWAKTKSPIGGPIPQVWTPPIDHEGYARLVVSEGGDPTAFLVRANEWRAANPPRAPRPKPVEIQIDFELALKALKRRGCTDWHQCLAAAGYTPHQITKIQARYDWLDENAVDLQAEINRRWGSGPVKKPKKAIKAVKKKM